MYRLMIDQDKEQTNQLISEQAMQQRKTMLILSPPYSFKKDKHSIK